MMYQAEYISYTGCFHSCWGTGAKTGLLGIAEPIDIVHLVIESPPLEDSFLLAVYVSNRRRILYGKPDTAGA